MGKKESSNLVNTYFIEDVRSGSWFIVFISECIFFIHSCLTLAISNLRVFYTVSSRPSPELQVCKKKFSTDGFMSVSIHLIIFFERCGVGGERCCILVVTSIILPGLPCLTALLPAEL